ncbi:MAG: GTP 3',8-cyclase MoaA, partial [Rhodospirillales bacterium]|nr:GTP 3',8-cyclase MoaA [Rhodospirillales bacterium]
FLPKNDLLSLEELERLCKTFIRMGVTRLRLTGGEPLVRRNVMSLIEGLGQYLGNGLEELTLTTNGSQLAKHAQGLAQAGVRRINVSLDTLDEAKFARITRWGRLQQVLEGISAAKAAGLAIKINMVALKGVNDDEFDTMLAFCGREGLDLCLIETMPMGEVTHREETHLRLADVRADIARRWTLLASDYATGGPARYVTVAETGQRLGFITPFSHNFCESCNRVRLTCTGTLYMCLGQEDAVDLRKPLRASSDDVALEAAINRGIAAKPKGHDFDIRRVAVPRHMSVTGG